MSDQALSGHPGTPVGFYGKVPVRGDFVTRHLPMEFIMPWDGWLQSGIAASREQMGEAWLETYLTSPLWRFVLSSGLCGAARWAGVVMPSVDRVGRYFPLTIVSPVNGSRGLAYLLSSAGTWFDQIEELALTALDNDFNLDTFETALARLQLPLLEVNPKDIRPKKNKDRNEEGRTAFQVGMSKSSDTPHAFAGLSEMLLKNYIPSFSLWNTGGSERVEGSLIACEGLPPVDVFSSFLNGRWQQHGWNIRTGRTQIFQAPEILAREKDSTLSNESENSCNDMRRTEPLSHSFRWTAYGTTDVGKKRKVNEDALFLNEEQGLWVVADGMGGHEAGDVASERVTGGFAEIRISGSIEDSVSQICDRLKQTNQDLYELAAEQYEHQVVGSTVVALTGRGNRCGLIWAGDSRIYRLRNGELLQLTRDHALIEEDSGTGGGFVDDTEPESFGRCNIITRAVGAESDLELDSEIIEVENGDTFLLCSDGLIKEVSAVEIGNLLATGTPRECVGRLMGLALDRGARDNVTVLVVHAHFT